MIEDRYRNRKEAQKALEAEGFEFIGVDYEDEGCYIFEQAAEDHGFDVYRVWDDGATEYDHED